MPPLKNNRWEKFCLACLDGLSATDAAIQAGYSPRTARQIGSKMLTNIYIRARLKELKEATASEKTISVLQCKEILSEIARADITDFVSEDGAVRLNKAVPNHRAVTRFSSRTVVTNEGETVTISEIKLSDPVAAIRELNKMDASYPSLKTAVTAEEDIMDIVFVLPDGSLRSPRELMEGLEMSTKVNNQLHPG